MDFYVVKTKRVKEGTLVYPDFIVKSSKDLLVKGRSFHAVWDEKAGLWSRDEMDVARMVDADLWAAAKEIDGIPLLMSSFESKSWTRYKKYVSMLDSSHVELDQFLTFADDTPDRSKFSSRRLNYNLSDTPCPAWDELVSTLYLRDQREKIEWAIGSIISGDSKMNQKFLVFYGPPGSGKSTIMSVIEKLFNGYTVPFDAKALTSSSNAFALSSFKSNPLVAIQHDGDLSRIEDNTKLNSIVSHEVLSINEKYKSEFHARANAFLFLGTNEPVKITGAKSGIIRRLIDVTPSGDQVPNKKYHALMSQIEFELGSIASHCLGVYLRLGKNYYSNYRPTSMMYETDVFYNYIEASYDMFFVDDGVALDKAWQMYKEFCEDALIKHRLPKHQFRTEMMSYFDKFEERTVVNGVRARSYFSGFKRHRFLKTDETDTLALELNHDTSLLDDILSDMPAQYASKAGTPIKAWGGVETTLKDIDTRELHFVKLPEKHIVIDFDLKDEHGDKSRELNLRAVAEWPSTYVEFSQGGAGVHAHYIYDGPGEVSDLVSEHKDGIEIKTLLGNASLRRRFSNSNGVEIAKIRSGLAFKEKPVHDAKMMSNEKSIRDLIIRNLGKEIHPGTKPSVEFIKKVLDDAYESGVPYDVSDLHPDIYSFALSSTNHARHCIRTVQDMKFMSEDMELKVVADSERLVFFDVEVFPNLFVVCWKYADDEHFTKLINPSADEIDELIKKRLIGFNNRRYDNHILYAASMGYSVEQIYNLSQRIISGDKDALFGGAYDLSYTDIFDFSSKKQGLKKFEIELGLKHQELGLPWDQDVDAEMVALVVEYCCNDVMATEATFYARSADFTARKILSELSGLSVNHSTQQHTARIIFGKNKKPQSEFIYTDLSEMFPGYEYDYGKSTYRDETVGEGGYVYAEPGVHTDVALLDVASMHPTSIQLLELFGPYTDKFGELVAARLAIKHKDYLEAKGMLDGKLSPFLDDESQAEDLSYALKIVINIVYGLTSARFENAFRDPRNKHHIVAKRGALFMIDLKHAVQEQGFTVAHIKTDSIKIPNATPEIIEFVTEFGKQYGYDFEHEATYPEFVLFNDAVYIAKYDEATAEKKGRTYETVGAQFQHPYVYKTLLSGEPIEFDDLRETRNVVKGEIFIVTGEERRFVGRIGQFIPVLEGHGGGSLMRVNEVDGERKDYAVTGTKGYLWREASEVQGMESDDVIDMSYYEALAGKARDALATVGYIL